MSERKQTPDILGDLLGGGPLIREAGETVVDLLKPAAVKRTKTAQKTRVEGKQPAETRMVGKPQEVRWEHRVASFQEYKGWRLRFVDGVETPNWTSGVTLCGYIAQASAEGWQVAGACAGQAMFGLLDKYQVFFKRLA